MSGKMKPPSPRRPMKVQATLMCFYGTRRQRPGAVFTLDKPEDFNPKSMVEVDPETPETYLTPQDALNQQYAQIKSGTAPKPPVDDDNPLGAD